MLRVLCPGASRYLVDVAGEMPGIHGLLARRVVRSGHLAGHRGGGIPQLRDAAGLHCTEAVSHRHPAMGRITYYRADRPE